MGRKIIIVILFACGCITSAAAQVTQEFSGKAAYYDKDYHDKVTAGGRYDPKKFTCAHLTLPFGTRLRVTDTKTHRSIVCTVNDRGPHSKRLVLDLSWAAATEMDMIKRGVVDIIAVVLPDEKK
jgi:rare lipoprotein A